MEPFPYWRNIYNTVVDEFKAVSVNYVSEVLSEVKKPLVEGILLYKKYEPDSYTTWKNKVQASKTGNIDKLMKDTSSSIDLDCTVTYRMFCNYIMFEYYGKITDIEEATCVELYRKLFIRKLWQFVAAERMFQLKTIQFLVQHYKEKGHKLSKVIDDFVTQQTLKTIREKLLEQFKMLIIENSSSENILNNQDYIERDRSELIQILITYIYTIEHEKLDGDEIAKFLDLFNQHGFALNIIFSGAECESRNLEYNTLLIALTNIWEESNWPHNFSKLEKIFNEISSMVNCHSVLILCWSMMLLALPPEKIPPRYFSKLPMLILESLNEESFKHLYNLLDNGYRNQSKLNILIYKAVYKFFKQICSRIDNIMKIYETENSILVLAKLMEIPEICDDVMTSNNQVRKLFDATINLYPYDTKSFALLLTTLIKHKKYSTNVVELLNHIQIYSEIPENSKISVPLQTPAYEISLMHNRTIVQYYGDNIQYSFMANLEIVFQDVLDYATNLQEDDMQKNEEINNVIVSMDLLCQLVDNSSDIWQDAHFQRVLTCCKTVLARINLESCRSPRLVNEILKLFTHGMQSRSKMLSTILLSTSCLPTATAHMLPVHQLVKINLLNDCPFLQLIMRERSAGNYQLVYTYLGFIKDCLEHQHENERFLLPGMIFIIQHVFPVHLGWKEPSVHEKNKMSYDILTMLLNILHSHAMKRAECSDRSLQLIYEVCLLTLLNNDAFVKTFLTILRYRNEYIEQLMIREVDWEIGCTRDVILSVRQAVTIVLWLFNNVEYQELKKTVFWQYFSYSGVCFPSVLRIICEYINHKFDSVLPKLACRLFRRISMDSSIPVLACMEIDNYQVQSMFLERLRDPLEDDEMRIALLELITTCVMTQNGMTAAFFNMHVKKAIDNILPEKSDETIINFLGEYIDSIAQSPETLRSPVQSAILTLFHTLWKEKRLSLIQTLITQDTFWKALINPLDKNYDFKSDTYYQILDILAMEAYYTKPNDLAKELQELFSVKLNLLKKIYTLVLHSLRKYDDDDITGVLKIQLAWKRFIILMIRNHKTVITEDAKLFLMKSTLEGLFDHVQSPKHTSIISNWLDLYMYLSQFDVSGFDTEDNFRLLCSCYKHIEDVYLRMNKKSREAVITIVIKSIKQFHSLFSKPCVIVNDYLFVVRKLIEKEYDDVMHRQGTELKCSDHVVWHLIVILGNHMLEYEHHHKWLFFTQLLHKIASSLGFYASSVVTMPIAKLSAMFLYKLAKTGLVDEFKGLDFADVYQSLKSPRELANYSALQNNGKNPDIYLDYWLTYSYLVNLKVVLLEKLGFCMFRKTLDFVHMQRDELFYFFKLLQVTVNPTALKLIASCIRLFNQLLRWDGAMDFSTITAYYEMLPEVLNSCINIILRPKMIKFYVPYEIVNLEMLESVPLVYVTTIMDGILDIISISCRGLLQVSPSLEKLIHRSSQQKTTQQLQIDWDFHIPNVYNPNENIKSLTFGALMCVVHYLSKTPAQSSNKNPAKKDAMLYIPTMVLEAESEKRLPIQTEIYISFLCPDYIEPASIEPFNSIHRFATSEIYSLTSPWLSQMDQDRTTIALELVNTLLASQIFKTVSMVICDHNQKQQMHMLKRELCSELHFFHDFVRKHSAHSNKYEVDGNRIVCIKKSKDKSFTSQDYLMMLSHWFMEICCLTP
ncbi:LOW QUALITY PROTEIN: nucleoporin Nup188 [Atheta coriaria]|uniref:LOW QUALITY PROTEIN: nucleoporin Nup188 n=1 Tax=Dalotia coriaria TaxID=877792 RepID=UPI0031F3CA49